MNIKESFNWMTPEFKIVDAGKNTIRIKGIAMKSDVLSRNKRKYVDEELMKSARTFVEKPVTINHDMNRIVGRIKWMEYENGALEYLADIKKQPYVNMLRDGSAEIRGVSIEANYLHNRCNKCGAQFYTEEDFHNHMKNEHFINTDPTSEPHGIIGQALSLVLSPEEPGYSDTSIELMETYQKPVLQLLETVTKTKIEEENYMKKLEGKAVLTPQSRTTVDTIKEQADGDQPPAHPTDEPEGGCDPGFHKDPETEECVADEIPAEPNKVIEQEAGTCPLGFHDDGAGGCAADPIPEELGPTNAPQITSEPEIEVPKVEAPSIPATPEQPPLDVTQTLGEQAEDNLQPVSHPVEAGGKECPIAGTHYDELSGTCIPDEFTEDATGAVEPPATKVVVEAKLPKLLSLGEPFADYSSHDDCVAKNPDKEDPDAYCASIEQKAKGEPPTTETMNIYESVKHAGTKAFIRDVKIAESVNTQNRAIAEIMKAFPVLARQLQKQQLKESRLRAAYDKQNVKFIKENMKATNTNTNLALKKLSKNFHDSLAKTSKALGEQNISNLEKSNKDIVEQTNKTLKSLSESVNKLSTFTNTKINQLATANKNLTAELRQNKKDYEKILEATSKVSTNKIRTLEERIKEQEDEKRKCGDDEHYDEEQGKCVPNKPKEPEQTEETNKKLTEMATKIENLEAKLTGKFKGTAKPLDEKTTGAVVKDPLKDKKR